MSSREGRYIHSRTSCRQITDLLQLIFLSELIMPSRCIWIVSPWISDIPVIDNRANQFQSFEPDWGRHKARISQVLNRLLGLGTTVHVATRPADHNDHFIRTLQTNTLDEYKLFVHLSEELHEKGILGDHYYLGGSMNLTYNGISLNEEAVYYYTHPRVVAENRLVLAARWGAERT